MWRLRCQLCLIPHDTLQLTLSHMMLCPPRLALGCLLLPLGHTFPALCSGPLAAHPQILASLWQLQRLLRSTSYLFKTLHQKGPPICLWSQASHAGSSVTLLPALFLLCAGRASPDQLLLELKTQARCQPFQAVPDHDSGALISHTEAALSASGVS